MFLYYKTIDNIMSESALQTIQEELKAIRSDLSYLKEHMVDVDSILTEDDFEALKKAEKEHSEGKTIKLKDLKTQLGL